MKSGSKSFFRGTLKHLNFKEDTRASALSAADRVAGWLGRKLELLLINISKEDARGGRTQEEEEEGGGAKAKQERKSGAEITP